MIQSCVVLQGMSGTHAFGREFQAPCQTAGHLARFAAGQTMSARQGRTSCAYRFPGNA